MWNRYTYIAVIVLKAKRYLCFKQFVYLCNITETFNEMKDISIEKGINKDNALLLCEWSNIQEVRIDKENIHIGRFIIAPRKTGLGLGTAALKRFIDFLFEDDNIKSISLTVFDFNQTAKRIYEKLGFEINEVIETPRLKYIMKRDR